MAETTAGKQSKMSLLSGIFPLDTIIRTVGDVVSQIGRARAVKAASAPTDSAFSRVIEQSLGARTIAQGDIDGDGSIDASEFGGPKNEFSILDANGDGKLSAAEIDARYGALLAHRQSETLVDGKMALSDFDMNGTLNRSEMGMSAKEFAQLDRDGDGELSRGELLRAFTIRGETGIF